MVDTAQKGERNERRAANILKRVYGVGGVEKVHTHGRNDPFHFTDIIALTPTRPVLFVQVKTNSLTPKEKRKYARYIKHRLPHENAIFEIWVREDYKGWRMYRWNPYSDSFEKYIHMKTCNTEQTVSIFRKTVGF